MPVRTITPFLFILLFAFRAHAQVKKYKAVSNVAGTDIYGYVFVDLTGENKGMIKFNAEGTLSDSNNLLRLLGITGKKDPTFSLNAGLVSSVVIGSDTFYRYDAEEGKETRKNIFVKKMAGKEKIRLYSHTNKKNETQYYVHLREDDPLENVNDVNTGSYITMSVFRPCEAMKERFIKEFKEKKSPFDNIPTSEGKAAVWKTLIEEYDACEKKP
jgi:hypothetical protein